MRERGIYPVFWPPFSPDLNPIETVWNKMKDYIAKHYPEKMSYDQLREAVKAAWEWFPKEELQELVQSIRDRCQAVIDAEGGHIPY
jgi:transposase